MDRKTKTERIARSRLMKDLIYQMHENWMLTTIAKGIPETCYTLGQDMEVAENKNEDQALS